MNPIYTLYHVGIFLGISRYIPVKEAPTGGLNSYTPEISLKNDGWKMSFLLGLPIFRGYVKFQGCMGFL